MEVIRGGWRFIKIIVLDRFFLFLFRVFILFRIFIIIGVVGVGKIILVRDFVCFWVRG